MIKKDKIEVPIYNVDIEVIFYENTKEIEDYLEEKGEERLDLEHYSGGALMNTNNDQFLILKSSASGFPNPGVIAHEAKHLVNDLFLHIGYKLDRENDEPEAYLLGFLVNEIHRIVKKYFNPIIEF